MKAIPALGDWIVAVAPQPPGFNLFDSEESKNDLTRRNWAYRWAKSHFRGARQYAAVSSFDHDAMVATEALERLMVALSKVVIVGKFGIAKLWKALSAISKELFGVGFSWGLFRKHLKPILDVVSDSRNVGPSGERKEDKNSSALKLAASSNSMAEGQQEEEVTASGKRLVAITAEKASDQSSEGVIRATAKQLMNLLGKACPFVGPGLWTIKRKEVSPLA